MPKRSLGESEGEHPCGTWPLHASFVLQLRITDPFAMKRKAPWTPEEDQRLLQMEEQIVPHDQRDKAEHLFAYIENCLRSYAPNG